MVVSKRNRGALVTSGSVQGLEVDEAATVGSGHSVGGCGAAEGRSTAMAVAATGDARDAAPSFPADIQAAGGGGTHREC